MELKRFITLYKKYNYLLLLLPALVLYTVFVAYPFVSSLFLSFFEWPGVGAKTFVGLANYKQVLFGSMQVEFFRALGHNAIFFALGWSLDIGIGLALALILATRLKGHRFFETLFFLPNTLSIVIVGFLWGLLLNPQRGFVNRFFEAVGLDFLAQPWLGDTTLALPTVIVVSSWRGMGFYLLVLLAAMLNIPKELFEAADIDGASIWQKIRNITIPLLVPTIGTLTILKLIWSFNIFDIVFAMTGTQAGPAHATDVLGTLFYRIAFGGLGSSYVDMGLGATVITLMFIVIFPISLIYVYFTERADQDAA